MTMPKEELLGRARILYRNSCISAPEHADMILQLINELESDAYTRPIVETLDELLLLPAYTVIQSDEGAIFQRKLANNEAWVEPGSYRTMWASEITLPATILLRG